MIAVSRIPGRSVWQLVREWVSPAPARETSGEPTQEMKLDRLRGRGRGSTGAAGSARSAATAAAAGRFAAGGGGSTATTAAAAAAATTTVSARVGQD
jgi:hypothetical protein